MMNEKANLPGDSIYGEKERRALSPSDAPSALRLRLKFVRMGRALCSQISVFSRCTYEEEGEWSLPFRRIVSGLRGD